jgi:ATP-binding cassette subfamily E protein 1
VKQRLKVAKRIHDLADTKKVMLIEHDLAVLDYLADYIYILYGKPGAYGAVSSIKNSRVGINEFLDGFLKAENLRIRDYSIRFDLRPTAEEKRKTASYKYS